MKAKFVIITEPKNVHFELPKDVHNNLKHYDFIIKHNKSKAERTTKNKISHLLSKYKHGDNHKYRKQESK